MRRTAAVLVLALLDMHALDAQQRRGGAPARGRAPTPTPAPPATTKVAPQMTCPAPLGTGVSTSRAFCDVLTGASPDQGILIDLPPHQGPVILTFDLHNRQT